MWPAIEIEPDALHPSASFTLYVGGGEVAVSALQPWIEPANPGLLRMLAELGLRHVQLPFTQLGFVGSLQGKHLEPQ
jgi:hypothetical protein